MDPQAPALTLRITSCESNGAVRSSLERPTESSQSRRHRLPQGSETTSGAFGREHGVASSAGNSKTPSTGMAPDADEQRAAAQAVMEVPLGRQGHRVYPGGKGRGARPMSSVLSMDGLKQTEQISAWSQPRAFEGTPLEPEGPRTTPD